MKFYLMKKSGVILFALIIGVFLFSCSKKSDSTTNPNQGKTAKFTITVTGATTQDNARFTFNSRAANGSTSIWKINEVVQNDQHLISLDSNNGDFVGNTKTYIVESTTPLNSISVSVSCMTAGGNFTVGFKAEINGVLKENDQNISVTPTVSYSPSFDY